MARFTFIAQVGEDLYVDLWRPFVIVSMVGAALIALTLVGSIGFGRRGRGDRSSVPARLTPLIAIADAIFFAAVFGWAPVFAVIPIAAQFLAFMSSRGAASRVPPPPMTDRQAES